MKRMVYLYRRSSSDELLEMIPLIPKSDWEIWLEAFEEYLTESEYTNEKKEDA